MKIIISLLFTIFVSMVSFGQQFDVRNTRWGMTMEDVVNSEGSSPIRKGTDATKKMSIEYETTIENRKVLITYYFENNRLSEVDYRYYWGDWQNINGTQIIATRIFSLSSLFYSLRDKNFIPYLNWHAWANQHTPTGVAFDNCQQYKESFDYNNENVQMLDNCCSKFYYDKNFVSIYINYENGRTFAEVKLPTVNYYDGLDKEVLGWVTFMPKGRKSDF